MSGDLRVHAGEKPVRPEEPLVIEALRFCRILREVSGHRGSHVEHVAPHIGHLVVLVVEAGEVDEVVFQSLGAVDGQDLDRATVRRVSLVGVFRELDEAFELPLFGQIVFRGDGPELPEAFRRELVFFAQFHRAGEPVHDRLGAMGDELVGDLAAEFAPSGLAVLAQDKRPGCWGHPGEATREAVVRVGRDFEDREESCRDWIIPHDRHGVLVGRLNLVGAQLFGDLGRVVIVGDQDGARDPVAEPAGLLAHLRFEDTAAFQVARDPFGLGAFRRVFDADLVRDAHPDRLSGLRRQRVCALLPEILVPVLGGQFGEVFPKVPRLQARQQGVDHLQDLRRAAAGLVQFGADAVGLDAFVKVGEQLAVAGAPFVERLLGISHDEQAAVLVILQDFVDVAA